VEGVRRDPGGVIKGAESVLADMYVSPAVRSIEEHPTEGESITLLVSATEDAAALEAPIEAAGGTVEERLEFETLAVSIPQTAIERVREIDGIESIETAQTLTIDPDGAGEDVSTPEE